LKKNPEGDPEKYDEKDLQHMRRYQFVLQLTVEWWRTVNDIWLKNLNCKRRKTTKTARVIYLSKTGKVSSYHSLTLGDMTL
jgi:hypothetical protein